MKQIQDFHNALHKSSVDTSRFLSAHLRSEARASGWPEHIVSHMGVTYGSGGFNAHVHDDHHDDAMRLEYGTSSTQPTAAVRRFANRMQGAEEFFTKRLSKHVGVL